MTIPPNPHPEQVEITQEDRELAVKLYRRFYPGGTPYSREKILRGSSDHDGLVRDLARHRLASLANRPADDGERLRQALEQQMETQEEDLPSSLARERGLVWLEGWFDLSAALTPQPDGEKRP